MTSVVDALGEWEHMRLQCFSSEIVLAVGSENEVLENREEVKRRRRRRMEFGRRGPVVRC